MCYEVSLIYVNTLVNITSFPDTQMLNVSFPATHRYIGLFSQL